MGSEPVLKKVDAWWTVLLTDPFAVRLTRLVRDVPSVTPTRMTVLAHVLGLACAALFLLEQPIVAGILFEVRFVLDCADGKLARERGTSSSAGAYLDYVGDYVVVACCSVAVGLALYWSGELTAWLAVAFPAAFLGHIVAGQARDIEAAATGMGRRPRPTRDVGRYERWMAERRLRPFPSRIEAEHWTFFVGPIVAEAIDEPRVLSWTVGAVTAYFTYRALRMLTAGYLIARDRHPTDRPQ